MNASEEGKIEAKCEKKNSPSTACAPNTAVPTCSTRFSATVISSRSFSNTDSERICMPLLRIYPSGYRIFVTDRFSATGNTHDFIISKNSGLFVALNCLASSGRTAGSSRISHRKSTVRSHAVDARGSSIQ